MLYFMLAFSSLISYGSVKCDFEFPRAKLEAFAPQGFRATFPEIDGVKLIAFHGNRCRSITQVEPGEINFEIVNPQRNKNKVWTYFSPNLKFEIGDSVNYWIYIQYNSEKHLKDRQRWEIKELVKLARKNVSCELRLSEIDAENRNLCNDEHLMFNGEFKKDSDFLKKWRILHFIPSFPDYEFCSYQNTKRTCFIKDDRLVIQPIPETLGTTSDNPKRLDFKDKCTSTAKAECFMAEECGFVLPPCTSSKLESLESLQYGIIEIKAKLPVGDWLYPQIYMQSSTDPMKKIWIAYSRGNRHLTGDKGDDIGATALYGGPILNGDEPDRSRHLHVVKSKENFGNKFRTYSLIWKPSEISVLIDGIIYGETPADISKNFNEKMKIVLGVGVGGLSDFPNNYKSGNKEKPWTNYERLQMKKFYKAKHDWLPTWKNNDSSLQIEYVKIWKFNT